MQLPSSLSPDGEALALHNSEGEITLIDTVTNDTISILQSDFGRVEQILWTKDSKQVLVHSLTGAKSLRFFDRSTGTEANYKGLTLPTYTQDISDCCINADNTLLVCLQRTHAYVFDFKTKTFLYTFSIQHCVKTSKVKFITEKSIGVRTDYGCFSIYKLKGESGNKD